MGGQRSSLIRFAIFLIKWLRPDVYIWENVKGAYSSNDGADYWAIIQAFANLDGYRCESQLLNTAWFLPQNRERIYLVGHFTGRSKLGVFPIRERGSFCVRSRTIAEKIHSDNILTLTQQARQYASWNGTFVNQINPSLESGGKQPYQQNRVYDAEGLAPTIDQAAGRWSVQVGDYRSDEGFRWRKDGNCPTINARARTDGNGQPVLNQATGIRRLTEIECERLQGFPDNWTAYGNYDGVIKPVPKTQRYKMCGNAVSVPVVRAIAERIEF